MQGLTSNVKPIGFIAGGYNSLSYRSKLTRKVNINDTQFIWRTDTSYVNGDNYALLLSQDNSTTLSSTFSISGGASPAAVSQPSSVAAAAPATATTAAAAASGIKHTPLTKGGIVGIVIGIVAILIACSTMLIFMLVLNVIKKKGAEAAAAAAAAGGEGGRHVDDDDDMSMTPLPSSTESPVVGTFYTKRGDSSTLGSGKNLSSTNSVPLRDRNGSAGSGDLSPGSPATLVPPHLQGLSLNNSAANSRGGTLPGTPTGLQAHGISPIGAHTTGGSLSSEYSKQARPPSATPAAFTAHEYRRPPSAAPGGWDDASRYSSSIHAVHPGAARPSSALPAPSLVPAALAAAPPPTGPLPEAPLPSFALPPPHALGAEQPWMQLPLQMHPAHHAGQGQQLMSGHQMQQGVPARRAVGLTPQGTGESGVSVEGRWSPEGPGGRGRS
jgi:hypothetical protein